MATNKGFIKDQRGNILLPITRGELILDSKGYIALNSDEFLAKDGHPGLITAAERAMLSNTGNGQNLTDIYTKLGHINSGLRVGQTTLNFYNEDGTSTPINFNGTANAPISIIATSQTDTSLKITGYTLSLGLSTISVSRDSNLTRIKDITVDDYGRVTAITKGAITNEELPQTIANKELSGCTASDPTSDGHIANKSYVDAQVAGATSIATGALVFKGTITSETLLSNLLSLNNVNGYYKVVPNSQSTGNTISIMSELDYLGIAREARLGDTLIIVNLNNSPKYVYIPSGNDDVVTNFTVTKNSENVMLQATGLVRLDFISDAFAVEKLAGSNVVKIELPQASGIYNGYLSSLDWVKFNSYASTLAVSYDPTITTSSAGYYEIGQLTIGGTSTTIYGQNNISSLSIDTTVETPTLKFTETGQSDVEITFSGVNGVQTIKDGNIIKIAQNSSVKADSISYLEISDTASGVKLFGVKIGGNKRVTEGSEQTTYVNGLADTDYVLTAIEQYTHSFEIISYSLKSTALDGQSDPYRYGNEKLRKAIGGSGVDTDASTWATLLI